jgi:hypothetical protein
MHTKKTIANEKNKIKKTKNSKTKEVGKKKKTSRKEKIYLKMTALVEP